MYPKSVFGWILYLTRSTLLMIWFFGISFLLLIVSLFRPFSYKNATLFCRWLSPMTLKLLGIKVDFRNREKAIENQPCIYLGNHQHTIDLFTFSYTLSDRTITLGKKQLKHIPIFGWLYWLSGQILIDRANNERALITLARANDILMQTRLSLFVFPEGTRSRGKGLAPFKKGAFHMAINTGFPLVPVIASDYFKFLKLGEWHAGTVIMEALDPIPVAGRNADELLAESREKMVAALDRINGELARSP